MKKRWLSDLKAVGKSSSPSLTVGRDKRVLLDKIAAALSETQLEPAPLSQSQIARIEAAIFERAFPDSPGQDAWSALSGDSGTVLKQTRPKVEGPVPKEVFRKGHLRLTGEFLPQVSPSALEIIELDSSERPEVHEPDASPAPAKRSRRAIKLAALSVGATYVLSATLAAASEGSRAGEMLYPVKLQIEAIRIAIAPSGQDKAMTYMEIAADRLAILRDLRRMDAGNISITAGEMDGAGLHALRLSERAPTKVRSGLLADLLALAEQEQRALETLISRPTQPAAESLAQSYQVAQRIELAALRLLMPTGTLPKSEIATGLDERSETLLQPKNVAKASGSVPSVLGSTGPVTGSPSQSTPTTAENVAEPDPDPEQPCAAPNGEICIILPIQLPAVLER